MYFEAIGTELYFFSIDENIFGDVKKLKDVASETFDDDEALFEIFALRVFTVDYITQSLVDDKAKVNEILEVYYSKISEYANETWDDGYELLTERNDSYAAEFRHSGKDFAMKIIQEFCDSCGQYDAMITLVFFQAAMDFHILQIKKVSDIVKGKFFEDVLNKCGNFSYTIAKTYVASKFAGAVIEKELGQLLDAFIDNPSKETAQKLVCYDPMLIFTFKECAPRGSLYERVSKRMLQNMEESPEKMNTAFEKCKK